MKRNRYIFVLMMSLVCQLSFAQTRIWNETLVGKPRHSRSVVHSHGLRSTQYDGIHHLVGFYVDGAYANHLKCNLDGYPASMGVMTDLGFIYNAQRNSFLFETGVSVGFMGFQDHMADLTTRAPLSMFGVNGEYVYSYVEQSRMARAMRVDVPLKFGGYVVNRLYMLGGIKLAFQPMGIYQRSYLLSTRFESSELIGGFDNLPQHGFGTNMPVNEAVVHESLHVGVYASLEIGYEWLLHRKGQEGYMRYVERDQRVRLSLFADLGSSDISNFMGDNSLNVAAGLKLSFLLYGNMVEERWMNGPRGLKKRLR